MTYEQNMRYRNKFNETTIYGTTLKIRDKYPLGCLIFIAEMNNEKNRIEGIGLIKNLLVHDKRHKIYDNGEYNRYIYRGKYWLSREQIHYFNPEILEIFDTVLFKGKSNLKCRMGITIITEQLFVHWIYELKDLKNKVKELFMNYFTKNIEEEEMITEEYVDIIPRKRKRTEEIINV
jgi:hypothetical protein